FIPSICQRAASGNLSGSRLRKTRRRIDGTPRWFHKKSPSSQRASAVQKELSGGRRRPVMRSTYSITSISIWTSTSCFSPSGVITTKRRCRSSSTGVSSSSRIVKLFIVIVLISGCVLATDFIDFHHLYRGPPAQLRRELHPESD